jgi:hypothetical protein
MVAARKANSDTSGPATMVQGRSAKTGKNAVDFVEVSSRFGDEMALG